MEEINYIKLNKEHTKDIFALFEWHDPNSDFNDEKVNGMLKEDISYGLTLKGELIAVCINIKQNEKILFHTIVVKKELRHQGFGTKLLTYTINQIQTQFPNTKIILHVMTTNSNAIGLYKKMGFKITQTIKDFYVAMFCKNKERDPNFNYDGYEMEL